MENDRFAQAIALFDAAHAEDPNREFFGGDEHPKELVYARRMTDWLDRLAPDASEVARLAARSQHIRRWTIPRSAYPMDRRGYRRWRTEAARLHANTAAEILRETGYDEQTIVRVRSLLRKERLKADPEVQLLEDVACLVFLESYCADFAKKHDEDKLVGILRKTWDKMSPRGRRAALGLQLPPELRTLLDKARSV